MRPIPYARPSIGSLEEEYVVDAVRNGWGSSAYEYITRFEDKFSSHFGVQHAIATSSCTGALHMGLHALGIGPDDEVILADINWVATVAPIHHLGAKPIFVDIRADSWCLDPEEVEAAISPRTKAIIATHLYGNLAEMESLLEIGVRYGVPVIEDAAEAIGSQYHGNAAGSMGRFGVFSFHGSKTITTGEGGMFVTNDSNLFERVTQLANHGRASRAAKQFWPEMIGFKYKMSNVQAAIGCAQLYRIEELLADKRRIFETYASHLRDSPVVMNPEPTGCVNGFWMPTIVVNEEVDFSRDALMASFDLSQIDARVFFWPLSKTPVFSKEFAGKNVRADSIYRRGLNLPSAYGLSDLDLEAVSRRVIEALEDII